MARQVADVSRSLLALHHLIVCMIALRIHVCAHVCECAHAFLILFLFCLIHLLPHSSNSPKARKARAEVEAARKVGTGFACMIETQLSTGPAT